MRNIYKIFTISILFISFSFLISPIKADAWFGYYHSANLGYNSPNSNYYNYRSYQDSYYNNRYNNSYNDIYYGGNSNDYSNPYYNMNYSYRAPVYNQGYSNYDYNYNSNNYGNYNSYNPSYTVSGWSRNYSYCTGFYCNQY